MSRSLRPCGRLGVLSVVALVAALGVPSGARASDHAAGPVSGGGGVGPPIAGATAPAPSGGASWQGPQGRPAGALPVEKHAAAPPPGPRVHGVWLSHMTLTEYWPVPEAWFVGGLVNAPGLPGKHRIDWLYSAQGLSMDGEGIGLDGKPYHVVTLGSGGWLTAAAQPTDAASGWPGGPPFWRSGGYWRNQSGGVTFPLQAGGWSAGTGLSYVPLAGVSFAPGPSLPLRPYQSIAVDPRVIPLGSRVYIPAERHDGHGGWFVAQDTGGAILGHRIDVFRMPPASPSAGGLYLASQRVFVVKAPS